MISPPRSCPQGVIPQTLCIMIAREADRNSPGSPDPQRTIDHGGAIGLRDLGYVEGKTIVFEFRWAETVVQLPELAAELARMNVDVILASSSTEADAAARA